MARKNTFVEPKYCRHKARDLAFVRICGRTYYLGRFNSPESRAEYDRLVGLWRLNGRKLPLETNPAIVSLNPAPVHQAATPAPALSLHDPAQAGLTVTELLDLFFADIEREYPSHEGRKNSELVSIESALFSLNKLYGSTPANLMKPVYLETVMQDYVVRGFCRKMINRNLSYCKRVFKWGVRRDYVTGEVYYKMTTVSGFRKGRGDAYDNEPVRPVDEDVVNATIPLLSDEVASMVKLQLLTGMRSGEVVKMRSCDIDMTGPVWRYALPKHKTANYGVVRQIPLGPKAQEIIRPFLTGKPHEYLFSPAKAEAKRRAELHAQRKTSLSCGNVPGSNKKSDPQRLAGEKYDSASYGRAIHRACTKAFPYPKELLPDTHAWKPAQKKEYMAAHGREIFEAHHAKVLDWCSQYRWHPHQLRHTASTRVARQFGEIASQNLLGHTNLKTTAIYTERNWQQAEEVMAKIG